MIGSIMMQGLWVLFIIETSENKLLYYKTATSKPWTYTTSVEQKTPSIVKSNKD